MTSLEELNAHFELLFKIDREQQPYRFPPIFVSIETYNLYNDWLMKMSNPKVQVMADLINADKKADAAKAKTEQDKIVADQNAKAKESGGTLVSDVIDKQTILGAPKPVDPVVSPILKGLAAEQDAARNSINNRADEINKDLKAHE